MIAIQSKKQDILIIGAAGMLGRELLAVAQRRGKRVAARSGSAALDITCPSAVDRCMDQVRPAIVINAAAYTDVDGAECDFERALSVNGDGPGVLARACLEHNALLIHYSTDYVFNGAARTPYRTDHSPDPLNSYGLSKLAGEKAVLSSGCRALILRTSWLYGTRGKNFVRTILRLASERESLEVVDDQRGRPTFCADLAEMTFDLLEANILPPSRGHASRILHAANSGHATWHELASHIVALAQLPCAVRPCTSESRLLHAPRPEYSVLDLSETIELIGRPRHWRQALRDCISAIDTPVRRHLPVHSPAPIPAATEEEL